MFIENRKLHLSKRIKTQLGKAQDLAFSFLSMNLLGLPDVGADLETWHLLGQEYLNVIAYARLSHCECAARPDTNCSKCACSAVQPALISCCE